MEINSPANTQITVILTASIAAVILIIIIVVFVLIIIVLLGLFFQWKSHNIIKSNNPAQCAASNVGYRPTSKDNDLQT